MPLARSYVLGAPPGAGYEATERAVRAFATHTFGERFDYAFVMHDDRPHPHAHLLARALGAKGERLRLQKGQPQALREAFAYELRREGIAVQATLQVERGEWRARESFALHKMRERLKNGRGPEPEAHKAVQRLAQSIGEHGEPPLTATEQRRIKRARDMKAYYLNAADLLLKSPDPDERTLGEGLRRFARWMPDLPPPRIVQAHAIYHARRVAEHIERRRSRDQDRDRDRVLER